MITRIFKTSFCFFLFLLLPVVVNSHATQVNLMTHKEAAQFMQEQQMSRLDAKFSLYESGIEMNLSEIKLERYLKKNPFKTVK